MEEEWLCDDKRDKEQHLEKTLGPSLEEWALDHCRVQCAGLGIEKVYIGASLCPAQQAACRFTAEH